MNFHIEAIKYDWRWVSILKESWMLFKPLSVERTLLLSIIKLETKYKLQRKNS